MCVLEYASACTKAQVQYVYICISCIYIYPIYVCISYIPIYVYIQDIYFYMELKQEYIYTFTPIPSSTLIFLLIGLICHSRISGPYIW